MIEWANGPCLLHEATRSYNTVWQMGGASAGAEKHITLSSWVRDLSVLVCTV